MKTRKWLDEDPPEDSIKIGETGRKYIPIGKIEEMLDELTDSNWDFTDFTIKIGIVGVNTVCCAHGILKVDYNGVIRRLTGGKSFIITGAKEENTDYTGAAVSHCIVSAATKLGNKFGRGLNGRLDINVNSEHGSINGKRKPDDIIRKQYANALSIADKESVELLEKTFDFNNKS